MSKKISVSTIKKEVVKHFGKPITIEKLSSSHGSKTATQARLVGVFLARANGHELEDISKTFGYTNPRSLYQALQRAEICFQKNEDLFANRVEILKNNLSME